MHASTLLLALGAAAVSAVPCSEHASGSGSGSGYASGSGSSDSGSSSYPTSSPPAYNGTVQPSTVAAALNTTSSYNTTTTKSSTVQCPVVLDGRVPTAAALAEFDADNGIFNPDYVKGNDLAWSEILLFPQAESSRFDGAEYKSVEVTINNASIFQEQYGFRRAGLQFADDTNEDSPGWAGQRTLHWSVKLDTQRALNLSHEYLNAWHEAADYSANQIMFQTGSMIDQPDLDSQTYKIFDRDSTLLYSAPIEPTEWQNFAINLDIDANTVQIYYSTGTDALEAVTDVVSADLSGMGQYQIGILKKPTGTSDVTNSGYQEAPVDEGLIYGGIFVEDSTDGCISL